MQLTYENRNDTASTNFPSREKMGLFPNRNPTAGFPKAIFLIRRLSLFRSSFDLILLQLAVQCCLSNPQQFRGCLFVAGSLPQCTENRASLQLFQRQQFFS